MTLNELYARQAELRKHVRLGIDTEDTWIELDHLYFAIKERKREEEQELKRTPDGA